MAWVKKGFIYKPGAEMPWTKSHAQGPTAFVMDDRIRVFFSTRPDPRESHPTYIDVDIQDPTKILAVHDGPILPLGKPGTFDEFGVMPSSLQRVGDEVWLYYTGWQRGQTITYTNAIGVAVSKDGGDSFKRIYDGPLTYCTRFEPYASMMPYVIRHEGKWLMWYGAGTGYVEENGKLEPDYDIYFAHSDNGLDWVRPNIRCIGKDNDDEATARPCVIFEDGKFHMWFGTRGVHDFRLGGGGSYRMGYATSKDGMKWDRDDSKVGITISESGWDSRMIAHPSIVDTKYGRYMFYNGNDFGAAGFGYAVWSK